MEPDGFAIAIGERLSGSLVLDRISIGQTVLTSSTSSSMPSTSILISWTLEIFSLLAIASLISLGAKTNPACRCQAVRNAKRKHIGRLLPRTAFGAAALPGCQAEFVWVGFIICCHRERT